MANDSQHELKQFKINIKGHHFSVSSQYSEDRIRRVEAFLSEKIDEVAANSDTYNLMSLTVLAALNLADDLLNIQRNREYISESARESLVSICQQLDHIVEKTN